MLKFFSSFLLSVAIFLISFHFAFANQTYGSGEYTNLCGTGYAASSDSCNGGCNTSSGSCAGAANTVVRFVCDGRQTACNQNETAFTSSQSIGDPGCNKTVAINVYKKNCRTGSGWSCGDSDMKDYIVWYSGACATQTPSQNQNQNTTPQPNYLSDNNNCGSKGVVCQNKGTCQNGVCVAPVVKPINQPTLTTNNYYYNATYPAQVYTQGSTQYSSCDGLQVVSGNNNLIPATVTLRARGSDNKGSIQSYRFYFGDGQQTESSQPEVQHQYTVSGTFIPRADVKDSQGNWKTSSACETVVNVTQSSIESFKSGCADVYITAYNNAVAPSRVTFDITGYDNKGSLQKYKMDFGNGVVKESDGRTFEQIYEKNGTYETKAYVKNSHGDWVGGTDTCDRVITIASSTPMKTQPSTGTPTALPLLGLGSGLMGVVIYGAKRRFALTN